MKLNLDLRNGTFQELSSQGIGMDKSYPEIRTHSTVFLQSSIPTHPKICPPPFSVLCLKVCYKKLRVQDALNQLVWLISGRALFKLSLQILFPHSDFAGQKTAT